MALPVLTAEARKQLRLEADDNSRDGEIDGWLADAAGEVERYTGVLLEQGPAKQTFGVFDGIELRAWPIAPDAAVSIAYTDAAGAAATLLTARLDLSRRPARLLPALSTRWPGITTGTSLTVTVQAGYASPEAMPRPFRSAVRRAMLLLVSAYDQDREGGEVFVAAQAAMKGLLRQYRLARL